MPISHQEYFSLQEKTGERFEFFDGQVYPRQGSEPIPEDDVRKMLHLQEASHIDAILNRLLDSLMARPIHSDVMVNLIAYLKPALDDTAFKVYNDSVSVYIQSQNRFVYPDTTVASREGATFREGLHLENPLVIFEVVSPSSVAKDKQDKLIGYTSIETLQDYVVVSIQEPLVEHFTRQEKGWGYFQYRRLSERVELAVIGQSLPVESVYDRVEF